jgi:hypothetical protein
LFVEMELVRYVGEIILEQIDEITTLEQHPLMPMAIKLASLTTSALGLTHYSPIFLIISLQLITDPSRRRLHFLAMGK